LKIGDLFKFGFDAVFDFTSNPYTNYVDIHAGAEIVVGQLLGIRGGYYSDRQFTEHYVTWGLGFNLNRLTIDWGMRIEAGEMERRIREDKPDDDSRIMISFGAQLAF
jgi:hypothetical protein